MQERRKGPSNSPEQKSLSVKLYLLNKNLPQLPTPLQKGIMIKYNTSR